MPDRQTVWVTANYVNGPKPGRKHGSIKTPEFGYVSVAEEHLHHFRPKARYSIIMETTDQGYHNFKGFAQQEQPQDQSGYQGYSEAPRRPPQQQARPPMQRPAPPPMQPRTLPMPAPQPSNDPAAKTIFITGVVGRAMGSGKFMSTDVLALTMAAKAAYEQVVLGQMQFGKNTIDPDLNDSPSFADEDTRPYDPNNNFTPVDEDSVPF